MYTLKYTIPNSSLMLKCPRIFKKIPYFLSISSLQIQNRFIANVMQKCKTVSERLSIFPTGNKFNYITLIPKRK